MEKLLLLSALFVTLFVDLCSAAGAYAQPNAVRQKQQNRAQDIGAMRNELGQVNEGQYAANLETVLQLLSERDAEEAVWRRNEAIERENLLAELSAQKRGFNYYGSRGKKSNGYEQQKRFNYFPSRG